MNLLHENRVMHLILLCMTRLSRTGLSATRPESLNRTLHYSTEMIECASYCQEQKVGRRICRATKIGRCTILD
jgi:hypothetical protein